MCQNVAMKPQHADSGQIASPTGIPGGTPPPTLPSRRDFLKTAAVAAVITGTAEALVTAAEQSSGSTSPAPIAYEKCRALAERFGKFLRVTDVTDGLDAVGRADLTLLDPAIRPLWMGMRFWGPALTLRVVPTNRRMPVVDRKDALRQHAIWNEMGGMHAKLNVTPGCVIVTAPPLHRPPGARTAASAGGTRPPAPGGARARAGSRR